MWYSLSLIVKMQEGAVTDPGPPQGGDANSKSGFKKLLFRLFSPKNCMKLNEFGPERGGGDPWRLLRSANGFFWTTSGKMYSWSHWFGHSNLSLQNQLNEDLIKKPTVVLSNKPNYKEVSLRKNKMHTIAVAMVNICLYI